MHEEPDWTFVTEADRAALMRDGVVVIGDQEHRGRRHVDITAYMAPERAHELTRAHFGADVDVEVAGDTPHRIWPTCCVGFAELAETLALDFAVGSGERLVDVDVAEDTRAVVVYASLCRPANFHIGPRRRVQWHVTVRPLGDREVIDGATGRAVPRVG